MSITVMKLALEALRTLHDENMDYFTRNKLGGENNQCMVFARETITSLRQAIEQAQQAEPVAKVVSTAPERIWLDLGFDPSDEDEISFNDLCDATWSHDNATGYGIEYVRADLASPPPRQPLTHLEIWNTYKNLWMFHPAEEPRLAGDVLKFARAIEAAVWEKQK